MEERLHVWVSDVYPCYVCRVRVGRAPPDRTHCADRQSALEKSVRCFAEKLGDEVIDPCLGTTFDSISEAYDFYNLYSWEHGFGIRYGKSRLNSEKTKCMQEIVCGCSVSLSTHYQGNLSLGCVVLCLTMHLLTENTLFVHCRGSLQVRTRGVAGVNALRWFACWGQPTMVGTLLNIGWLTTMYWRRRVVRQPSGHLTGT
jgi:hypothetical protein